MNTPSKVVAHRLKWFRYHNNKSRNIAQTCRYFGISRSTYYFWWRRYQNYGKRGLKNRSTRPHHSPKAISAVVKRKIIKLRKSQKMSTAKISSYISQNHGIYVSRKSIWKVLKSKNLNVLDKSRF